MDVTIPCPCPGTPHEKDTVTFLDRLGFVAGRSVRNAIVFLYAGGEDAPPEQVAATATQQYLRWGIAAWTLVDEKGKPLPATWPNISALIERDPRTADQLADAADNIYAEAVMAPLVPRASASSPPTPTDESTSPPTDSSSRRPRPLRPSSTSTSQTADTATTSSPPAGDSSSSQNSASAA
jgi:hypothetical protein